jgi:hypothetical protein
MYYLTKIFEKKTEFMDQMEFKHSSDAYDISRQLVQEDKEIVAILIFSDKDTATVVKRSTLLKIDL